MFVCVTRFADRLDGNRIYGAGEHYPRPGLDVSPERLAELAGRDNRAHQPLIAPETPTEAVSGEPKEMPAETGKPAEKPARGRKKRVEE